jgi:hypothetical protein
MMFLLWTKTSGDSGISKRNGNGIEMTGLTNNDSHGKSVNQFWQGQIAKQHQQAERQSGADS